MRNVGGVAIRVPDAAPRISARTNLPRLEYRNPCINCHRLIVYIGTHDIRTRQRRDIIPSGANSSSGVAGEGPGMELVSERFTARKWEQVQINI